MNKLRAMAWALVATPVGVLVAIGTPSCSSASKSPEGLAEGCSINSDCNNPLICAFSLCHQQCAASRDCSDGAHCVEENGVGVCELPTEIACSKTMACAGNLVCAPDQQCRAPCTTATVSTACAQMQTCSDGLCYDPGELDGTAGNEGGSSSGGGSGSGSGGDASPDGPLVEAGPLGYVPSNLGTITIADGGIPDAGADAGPPAIIGADGGIDWTNAVDVSITSNCSASCLGPGITLAQSDANHSPATLYVVKSLQLASGFILTLNGPNPVLIASLGDVDIQGSVNVNGVQASLYAGAGGYPLFGQNGASPQGPGAGGNGFGGTYPTSAAGGGSYCGTGGKGAGTGLIAPGGGTYGNALVVPLLAGSAGGYAESTSYSGFSGGAVQISSATSIIVRTVGVINAGGAGSLGGGGSGGAILLEAPTVTIAGTLAANGGGGGTYNGGVGAGATPSSMPALGTSNGGAGSAGPTITGTAGVLGDAGANTYGGGGGGAGYIRINVGSGGAILDGGTISPDLTTTCATQGTLTQ